MTNELYLKPPKDRPLYRRVAFMMSVLGLNAQVWNWVEMPKNWFLRAQRLIMIYLEPVTTVSQIIFMYMYYQDYSFAELTVMLAIIPTCVNMMIKLMIAQTNVYQDAMRDFMQKIHLYNYYIKDPENESVKKALIQAEKLTKFCCLQLMITTTLCTTSWEIVPIVHNIKNNPDLNNITVRLEVCTHIWLPFEYEYDFYRWCLVQVVAIYCSYLGIAVMCLFDTICLACVFHLHGHIKIFRDKLETRFRGRMTEREMKETLVELSLDYNLIKDVLSKFEGAFGFYILATYAQNLMEGAVLIFVLSSGTLEADTLSTFGTMICYLQGQLMMLSYSLEYVRILAEDIPTLVYNIPWEVMPVKIQKMVWMLLFQVQPLMEFRASFNFKTGVQPAINILKTTFSYYVMLKEKNE